MNGSKNSPGEVEFVVMCLAMLVVAVILRLLGYDLSLENLINTLF